MRNSQYEPLLLVPTRVRRTYRGGSGLDLWHLKPGAQGEPKENVWPEEGERPEEWIASMTEAVNPGFLPEEGEGLSVTVRDGTRVPLRELARQDPEGMLGVEHVKRCGAQPGVLVKMIDSAERLSIQVHPDRAFARQYFHSDYGKTECWHILKTRETGGQQPFLLIGFAPGVTRERWEDVFRRQDIPAMTACLNRVTPHPGETWLIRGGVPHAIGPGCLLLEIQEPTDYTLRSERTTADGRRIPDQLIHQGLGEEALMDCFHYETMDTAGLNERCRIEPQSMHYPDNSSWSLLIGPRDTPCFAMERVSVRGGLAFEPTGTFSSLVVHGGRGELCYDGGCLPLEQAAQVFLPAAMGGFTLRAAGAEPLTALRCHPPGVLPQAPAQAG